jgi:hypothetical protein
MPTLTGIEAPQDSRMEWWTPAASPTDPVPSGRRNAVVLSEGFGARIGTSSGCSHAVAHSR